MKAGRKTKFNKKVAEIILEAIENGRPIKYACMSAGINQLTFYRWLREGNRGKNKALSKFCKQVEKAKADAIGKFLNALDAQGFQGAWQAIAWRLERIDNEEFGRREKTEVSGELKSDIKNVNIIVKPFTAKDVKDENSK